MSRLLSLTFTAILPACLGQPAVGPPIPGGGSRALEATFASIDAVVLTPRCASSACHGGTGGAPLSLAPGSGFVDLVGVPSEQVPGISLVAPGDPSRSYLLLKLEGTQTSVGGYGDQMPPDGDLLSDEEIATIEAWIAAGAPND